MMRTAKRARDYYNSFTGYDLSLGEIGYICPDILAQKVKTILSGKETVLDLGCGTGLVGEKLHDAGWRGKLVGVDIAELRLREARQKEAYSSCIHADAYHLPFNDQAFDVVLSCALVGIVGPKAILEMCRVLKPSGYLGCILGEAKNKKWSRINYRKARMRLSSLAARMIFCRDIGSGYLPPRPNEHYALYLIQKKSR